MSGNRPTTREPNHDDGDEPTQVASPTDSGSLPTAVTTSLITGTGHDLLEDDVTRFDPFAEQRALDGDVSRVAPEDQPTVSALVPSEPSDLDEPTVLHNPREPQAVRLEGLSAPMLIPKESHEAPLTLPTEAIQTDGSKSADVLTVPVSFDEMADEATLLRDGAEGIASPRPKSDLKRIKRPTEQTVAEGPAKRRRRIPSSMPELVDLEGDTERDEPEDNDTSLDRSLEERIRDAEAANFQTPAVEPQPIPIEVKSIFSIGAPQAGMKFDDSALMWRWIGIAIVVALIGLGLASAYFFMKK